MTTSLALTRIERATLHDCEAQIAAAFGDMRTARHTIGRNLHRIIAGRLHREVCDTVDEYVEMRWNLPRSTAYEWVQLSQVESALEQPVVIDGESRVIDPPARISHAKELAKLPAGAIAPALHEARQMAHERGASEPTTYEVKRVVFARLGEQAPRTSAELSHEREQRALCDLIRRTWPRIDAERRRELLRELDA